MRTKTTVAKKPKAPKFKSTFKLPVELYRGWYNPFTGLTADKLGI